jgi:hypothetical protein
MTREAPLSSIRATLHSGNIQGNQERSIGDHFIYENLGSKMWPNETNEEIDQLSNKLNIYLW